MMKMNLQSIADYIETYSGRDRIMRVIFYSSQLISGLTSCEKLSHKLNILSDQIDSCRTVLRLFDDIPMLCYTVFYGFGKEDPDKFMRLCGVAVNVLDQIYYPLEHIAWAADSKLVSVPSEPWWTASTVCWALSMYIMIFKSLRYYILLKDIKNALKPDHIHYTSNLLKVQETLRLELLTAARCLLDCLQAVHFLPSGWLWAGKLRQWHIGFLGVISSLISIYQST